MKESVAAALPARSVLDMLLQRRDEDPHALAVASLRDDLSVRSTLTRSQLLQGASRIAATLKSRTAPGDRILLAYENGTEVAAAFWGTLLAGRIPVPAPAPTSSRTARASTRIDLIARDCGARVALTTSEIRSDIRIDGYDGDWITTDTGLDPGNNCAPSDRPGPGDIAYLQYTSGSTREPRGVVLTYEALAAHTEAGLRLSSWDRATAALSWLPYFHDYGLLHGLVVPLVAGCPSYLMNPATFLRRPLLWLEAIGRYGVSHSGAPNFAFDACSRALRRTPGWRGSLATWIVASCGAETIRPQTLRRFSADFAPHGFLPTAFTPGYGLAEATLVLALKTAGEAPRITGFDTEALQRGVAAPANQGKVIELVSNGKPLDVLQSLLIVDPERCVAVPEGTVGEVWAAGRSLGSRYWNRPDDSAAVFGARLADKEGPVHLRTGDLGFLWGGELYIAARLKDVIIVRGRNYHPQDLEWTATAAHPALRPGYAAAFGTQTGEIEGAVIACEVAASASLDADSVTAAIRGRIAEEYSLELADVVLVRAGALPRTSSGKVQRQACRALHESQRLNRAPGSRSSATLLAGVPEALVASIAAIWAEVLDIAEPTSGMHFFEAGGSSILATQAVSRVNAEFGLDVPIRAVFEHPTPRGFAAYVANLRMAHGDRAPTGIQPKLVQRPSSVPLSFSQRRMWILHRLNPQSAAYNMPVALRLRGLLHVSAMQIALDAVVDRHESLRTIFRFADSEPVQIILAGSGLPIIHHDVSVRPESERLAAAMLLLQADAAAPFDLATGPLVRAHLIRLADDDHVLMLNQHHIIGDQWSYAVLARELAQLYARETGQPSGELPPLGMHYADYAVWQRRRLTDRTLVTQRDYWRRKLAGLEPLALPTDFPAIAEERYKGARISVPLPEGLLDVLQRLSVRQNATLFMTLLGTFHVLLARYTGQEDVAIGVPIANRRDVAAECLVGTLVNTLVLRLDLSGDPDFNSLLGRVREVALEAYAHQDMPFEALVEDLGAGRDRTSPPLVRVLFNLVNVPIVGVEFDGLEWALIDFDRGATQFDLTLTVDPQLLRSISLEYSTDLFTQDTAARLLSHYVQLLRSVASQPHLPVSRLDMLLPEELHQLRVAWNETSGPYPRQQRTDELIAVQAEQSPFATAVREESRTVCYADLERSASALAVELRRLGAGRGVRIGICLGRSAAMLTALIAVMKSGAAYVPFDPSFPAERLKFMGEDSRIAFVLTEEAVADVLTGCSFPRVDLHEALRRCGENPEDSLDHVATADDPVYVIYTSGSTGQPKGVEVSHRSLVNLLWAMREKPGFAAGSVLLSVTTLSFDIAALELYLPLVCGGTVALVDTNAAGDSRLLASALERIRPDVMQATPSTWMMLIESGWQGSTGLTALCGGEALSAHLAEQLAARTAALWNMYGPTETTIWSLTDKVIPGEPVCIGRPIANTTVQVLDSHGAIVPIGARGELYIGGDGVALGYVDRPELDAERFVPDRHSPVAGSRLYRTGDLVRFLPDGRLEFLGRTDHQAKIRGHRIEPGEIEARLLDHPGVSRAVCLVREDRAGDMRLVAYFVSEQQPIDEISLRLHLLGVLPRHMVPQYFVQLESIPRLPNGKIDRKRLPVPAVTLAQTAKPSPELQQYASGTEAELARVWCGLLGLDSIEPQDNFFDLGGHSLLAMQAIAKMEERTGKSLHARRYIFETFSQIALSYDEAGLTGRFQQIRLDSKS